MSKVEVKNVYKTYNMFARKVDKLLNLFSLTPRSTPKQFMAVKNASFKVNDGETIGIVGLNGSGKSTLSNILARVIQPTEGETIINGETSLIAISAGLNNNLSGLENIELKCMMHGLDTERIEQMKPLIIEFADIGDYIEQPVKNYSSGMRSRLGFAIAVHTDPDILIIDEALSVGDSTFANRCLNKMEEFKQQGKTIFFISHSVSQMKEFCDRIIWMHYGEIKDFGPTAEIVASYTDFVKWVNGLTEKEKQAHKRKMLKGQYTVAESAKVKQTEGKNKLKILGNIGIFIPLIFLGVLVIMGH